MIIICNSVAFKVPSALILSIEPRVANLDSNVVLPFKEADIGQRLEVSGESLGNTPFYRDNRSNTTVFEHKEYFDTLRSSITLCVP